MRRDITSLDAIVAWHRGPVDSRTSEGPILDPHRSSALILAHVQSQRQPAPPIAHLDDGLVHQRFRSA